MVEASDDGACAADGVCAKHNRFVCMHIRNAVMVDNAE